MSKYQATIGLEIHAELRTVTKMFCRSKNDPYHAAPNTHICPVCMAHPGTLPLINREAIRQVLRVGTALGSTLANYTEFDRKNYFYPDLPKGYQLSQFDFPLVRGGVLANVAITRIHLEEDTASSIHDDITETTLIDYNRAGVPLMELVTEPVIRSAEEAGNFARELQLLLRYLSASEANMERGEMRVEANVSVAPVGERSSAYVEIKNLNSFRAMERAVAYEIRRQEYILSSGGTIAKETLGWDEGKQATFPQRSKEGSADYRYFPDPDLPSLLLSETPEFNLETLQKSIGELPTMRRDRYRSLGLKADDIDSFVRDRRFGDFFDEVTAQMSSEEVLLAGNYIANDLVKIIRDLDTRDTDLLHVIPISARNFKKLIELVHTGSITSRVAKDILIVMVNHDQDPKEYATEQGLMTTQENVTLEPVVDSVISQNPLVVADFKAGKLAALEFLLGQCMKILRGSGKPDTLRSMILQRIQD